MISYETITSQLRALAEESRDCVALMANAAALLYERLPDLNWAGFYLVKSDVLLLGPFQGKIACVRIAFGKGVCGSAWQMNCTLRVPDVHAFPGHIACDSASRSEIVIPLHEGTKVRAVLDMDSPLPNRFSEADQQGLEYFAVALEELIDWP